GGRRTPWVRVHYRLGCLRDWLDQPPDLHAHDLGPAPRVDQRDRRFAPAGTEIPVHRTADLYLDGRLRTECARRIVPAHGSSVWPGPTRGRLRNAVYTVSDGVPPRERRPHRPQLHRVRRPGSRLSRGAAVLRRYVFPLPLCLAGSKTGVVEKSSWG